MLVAKEPIDLVDHRVMEGVAGALRCSPYLALRMLSCRVTQRVVTLSGRLPSFYLKQVAQSLASGVEGALEVRSEIDVTYREQVLGNIATAAEIREQQPLWGNTE